MDKVIGIDINYKDLCQTHKLPCPDMPVFFGKFASTVIGPGDAVRIRTRLVEVICRLKLDPESGFLETNDVVFSATFIAFDYARSML